jgi:hypothetical protein
MDRPLKIDATDDCLFGGIQGHFDQGDLRRQKMSEATRQRRFSATALTDKQHAATTRIDGVQQQRQLCPFHALLPHICR